MRARALGQPLTFDEVATSRVYAPDDVPLRNSREEVRPPGVLRRGIQI